MNLRSLTLRLVALAAFFVACAPAHAVEHCDLAAESADFNTDHFEVTGALSGYVSFEDAGCPDDATIAYSVWNRTTNAIATATGIIDYDTDTLGYTEIVTSTGSALVYSPGDQIEIKAQLLSSDMDGKQPLDPDLTSWAGVIRASGFDTFTATPTMANLGTLLTDDASGWTTFGTTPSSANLRTLLTDETGTGAALFAQGAICGTDPGADRIAFWDESGNICDWLTPGNGLTITTTSIAVDSASLTVDGIVELATAAEYWNGTDSTRPLAPDQIWLAGGLVSVASSGNVLALNENVGINFLVTTLSENTTLTPSNERRSAGCLVFPPSTTSTRTVALGSEMFAATGVEPFPISITTSDNVTICYWSQSSTVTWITGVFRR